MRKRAHCHADLMTAQQTYIAAAYAFADLVAALPAESLAGPGLGEWTLRDLLGHSVSAGLTNVLAGLDRLATAEAVATGEAYYALAKTLDPAIVQAAVAHSTVDARQTGESLGAQPADAVREIVDRVVTAVAEAEPDALVTSSGGGMRLEAWLPTRTFELVVHGLDLAAAAGVKFEPPVDALAEAAALSARIAAVTGGGQQVVLALTGRQPLPAGFSVV